MHLLVKYPENEYSLARTRGGAVFDPNANSWRIREGSENANLDFAEISDILEPEVIKGFKKTLIWYAESKSLRHLFNMFKYGVYLFKYLFELNDIKIKEISEIDILNYRSTLQEDKEWYLGALKGFLKKWHALGYSGVTQGAISLLGSIRIKGNKKGVAVLTMDTHDGPFTEIELESIQAALNKTYALGEISKESYLLAWMLILLGQRPTQYALMKVIDVHAPSLKDGSRIYSVMIPRGKQRHAPRLEFKERLLIPQIGELLWTYANDVKNSFEEKLADPRQAPLFPAYSQSRQPAGMEYHLTSSQLGMRLTELLTKLKVFSERSGQLIHITPTRFRRTLGTRAAREGHGELIIAELLDHNDTQNVGVYVQSTPEIVERIDKAVALALAPMAQAFAGVIIPDESAASRRADPSSRIFDPRIEATCKPMGNCGSHGFCGFSAPIACYTCHSFQAWVDGPHEAVLEHLLADRERKLANADIRIAKINDRTILAVADVIRQCEAAKAKPDFNEYD